MTKTETAILEKLGELEKRIEQLGTLMCPVCGPAEIARMHPESGPSALRPAPVPSYSPEDLAADLSSRR